MLAEQNQFYHRLKRWDETDATPEVQILQTASCGGFRADDPRTLKLLFLRPLIDPRIDGLVPHAAVLRFQYPVSFIRKIQHFGRDIQPL